MDLKKWTSNKKQHHKGYAAWWIIPDKGYELKIMPESNPQEIIVFELPIEKKRVGGAT